MDDATLTVIAAAVIPAITAVVIAVVNAKSNVRVAEIMKGVSEQVHKIELNTNSMKDALVAVTGEAASAKGQLIGRADQRAETALAGSDVTPKGKPATIEIAGTVEVAKDAVDIQASSKKK